MSGVSFMPLVIAFDFVSVVMLIVGLNFTRML